MFSKCTHGTPSRGSRRSEPPLLRHSRDLSWLCWGHKHPRESNRQGSLLLGPRGFQFIFFGDKLQSHQMPAILIPALVEAQREEERQGPSPTASAFTLMSQQVTPAQFLPHTSAGSSVWPSGSHPVSSAPALYQGQRGLRQLLSPGPRPRRLTCSSFPDLLCPEA